MALSKQIKDTKGQITSYHRIRATSQDYDNNKLYVNLAGYTDEQYRLMEKEATPENKVDTIVVSIGLELSLIDNDFSKSNIYTRIKTECQGWDDSVDC